MEFTMEFTIEKEFEDFLGNVYGQNISKISEQQQKEVKRFFFAGATSILGTLIALGSNEEVDQEVASEILKNLMEECTLFAMAQNEVPPK